MQYHHFTIEEREAIHYGRFQGKSLRTIAKGLNRSVSSVSREVQRNLVNKEHRVYASRIAHERALKNRQSRGRIDRLKNQQIRKYVIKYLKQGWSPEQISGRIKLDLKQSISHETIYQFIYAQVYREGWGELKPGKEDLRIYLRRRRKRRMRKGLRSVQKLPKHGGISIEQRPMIVNKRKRIGDWETDTVESKDHKPGLNTLVERKTGLVFMTKLANRTSTATVSAIEQRLNQLPAKTRQTLTLDNGFENQNWKEIEARTNLKCYYAHAYHSWERGTNENTNGLIREYFPKRTDFTAIPEEQIKAIEFKLNTRPRKRLKYLTPLEAFSIALQG